MDQLREVIIDHAGRIHSALCAQLDAVESLYAPASDFIAQAEVVKSAGLEFNAELRMLPTWRSVATGLDGRRNGDFSDWLTELPQRIEDTSWEQLSLQLRDALLRLEHERGERDAPFRNPANALRSTTTVNDFLIGMSPPFLVGSALRAHGGRPPAIPTVSGTTRTRARTVLPCGRPPAHAATSRPARREPRQRDDRRLRACPRYT